MYFLILNWALNCVIVLFCFLKKILQSGGCGSSGRERERENTKLLKVTLWIGGAHHTGVGDENTAQTCTKVKRTCNCCILSLDCPIFSKNQETNIVGDSLGLQGYHSHYTSLQNVTMMWTNINRLFVVFYYLWFCPPLLRWIIEH